MALSLVSSPVEEWSGLSRQTPRGLAQVLAPKQWEPALAEARVWRRFDLLRFCVLPERRPSTGRFSEHHWRIPQEQSMLLRSKPPQWYRVSQWLLERKTDTPFRTHNDGVCRSNSE